jgi:hypothetical protein
MSLAIQLAAILEKADLALTKSEALSIYEKLPYDEIKELIYVAEWLNNYALVTNGNLELATALANLNAKLNKDARYDV